MATFVLVHGSWHGGWCFDPVRARLEAAGHHVAAPDLPGMGADEAGLKAVTLAGWAGFVADICRSAPQRPVVLAGHSRGGLVVSEVAERAPDAVDALVYICAMMLPDGMSRAGFKETEGPNPPFDSLIRSVPGGSVIAGADPAAVFAQMSPPGLAEAAAARLVAEPSAPRSTPVHITAERFGTLPRVYVECTADRVIPLPGQRRMQQMVPGARVVTLWADHSPFYSRPEALTRALIEAIPSAPA